MRQLPVIQTVIAPLAVAARIVALVGLIGKLLDVIGKALDGLAGQPAPQPIPVRVRR